LCNPVPEILSINFNIYIHLQKAYNRGLAGKFTAEVEEEKNLK